MANSSGKAVVRAGQTDPRTGRKALPGTGAPGPGRPKGVPNKKIPEHRARAQDILQKILKQGPTPLEIMWNFIKYPWICSECDKLYELRITPRQKCECGALGSKLVRNFDPVMLEAAKSAAPYVHPKLQQIQLSGQLGITHEEALARLDRLDAGEDAIAEDAEYTIEDAEPSPA